MTGKTITDSDLKRGIKIMNDVRRVMMEICLFRKLDRDQDKRLLIVESENDDIEFIQMVETLGERESVGGTVVAEEHCTITRYFRDEVAEDCDDPLIDIASRYVERPPCTSKDRPGRSRLNRTLKFA